MKNYKTILAITAMAILATAVAFVSCKKETENTLNPKNNNTQLTSNINNIEDMNAYLKDFKQKMLESKSDEILSLDDAAWHLSSLANYDFGYANVEFTDILFDTLYFNVLVTDGGVRLSDLAVSYAAISTAIDSYYQSLELENRHFRYISAKIMEDGTIAMGLLLTYGISRDYHNWYPNDTLFYNQYFDENIQYHAISNGMLAIEYMLNSIDSYPLGQEESRAYLTYARDEMPLFVDYIDLNGSPNFLDSRIWCTQAYLNEILPFDEMTYYVSSYHALGRSFLHIINNTSEEDIACWDLDWDVYPHDPDAINQMNYQQTYYHVLTITIGRWTIAPAPNPY